MEAETDKGASDQGKQCVRFMLLAWLFSYFAVHMLLIRLIASDIMQAAVALCVGVGYFADPKDFQGLAHFLGAWITYHR